MKYIHGLAVLFLVLQKGCAVPAPNDQCSGATAIQALPYEDDDTTAEATVDLEDGVCQVESTAKGNWYKFVGTGRLTEIRYTAAFQYKQLVLYKGTNCHALLCVLFQRHSGKGGTAERSFISEANQTYYLLLTGYNSGLGPTWHTGGYALDLEDFDPPHNDQCVGATAVTSFPYADDGTTFAALPDAEDTLCKVEDGYPGVWYSFVGEGKATEIRYQTGFLYKQLAIYQGADCENLVCVAQVRGTGIGSFVEQSLVAEAGETYKLLLTSHSSTLPQQISGNYGLDIEVRQPPANDNCDNAITITDLPFQDDGDTTNALFDAEDSLCNVDAESRGVWYSMVGSGNWTEFRYTTGFFYKHMAIYKGTCAEKACVANERRTGYDTTAVLSLVLEAKANYYILLTGYGTSAPNLVSGNYGLGVEEQDTPANDQCQNAIAATSFPFEDDGSTQYAHEEVEDTLCNVDAGARGVWYSFVSSGGWTEIFYSTGFFYKHMALYKGASCGGTTCETNKRCTGYDTTCELSLVLEAGETYFLLLTGYGTAAAHMVSGNYALKLVELPSPDNDDCDSAFNITSLPFHRDGSTERATSEGFEDSICGVDAGSRGVWYSLVGTGSVTKLRYTSGFFYKHMAIYKGSTCHGGRICVTFEREFGAGATAEIFTVLEADTIYHILLTGYGTAAASQVTGDYAISVEVFDKPINDDCEDATVVSGFPFAEDGDTTYALTDAEDTLCNVDATARGVWYEFESNGGWTEILYSSGFFYRHMALYTGTCGSLLCEANTRCTGFDGTCELTMVMEAGTTYHLLLTGYGTSGASMVSGNYGIDIEELPPPENDECENAIAAPSLPFDDDGNTEHATTDFEDTICNVEAEARGVWYTTVGTGKWTSIMFMTGFFYKHLALYKGTSCDDLNCVTYTSKAGYDDAAELTLILDDDQIYYLLLTGYTTSTANLVTGSYGLDVTDHEPPSNDKCVNAVDVQSLTFEDDGDTTNARPFFDDSLCGVEPDVRGVWYRFVGDGFPATVRYTTEFFYKHLSVYRGQCSELICDDSARKEVPGTTLEHTWDTQAGVVYYIFLTGYTPANNYGQYQFDLTSSAPTPAPSPAPTVRPNILPGLYGTSGYDGSGGQVSNLYLIDPSTGVSVLIGPVFVSGMGVDEPVLLDGLSYDPVTGHMLAHTAVDSPYAASSLLSLNVETGQARVIGTATSVNTHGLAVQATGGVAYSWSEEGALVMISPHTGEDVILGPGGVASVGNHSFAFDDDGDVMHLLNQEGSDHYTVSTVTGEATWVGTFEPLIGTTNGDIQPKRSLFFAPSVGGTGLLQVYDLDSSGVQSTVIPTGIVGLYTLAFAQEATANPTRAPSNAPSFIPSNRPTNWNDGEDDVCTCVGCGSCLTPHREHGCDCEPCQQIVCVLEPVCCADGASWIGLCANTAVAECQCCSPEP